ncbi:hypothetical protein CRUP_029718 [Coryphaenoides rupestris]|nr:hypothetical protein CRUP_029718 [Coryphaenoides rupestris]
MSRNNKSSAEAHIIADGEDEAEEAELNPFSFREFIRQHGPDPDSEGPTRGSSRDKVHGTRKQTFAPAVESILLWEPLPSVLRAQEGAAECGLAAAAEEEEDSSSSLWLPDEDEDQDKEIRVQQLSEELVRRRHEEEKEAQALERMVHSVEQNLHLMTKRAVKAENGISKLKQELHQLQTIKSENERLLAEQLENMTTMKHNAQMAAEYLGKTAVQAQISIKQLLGEAENLHLVSQLLQSIDKISTHTSDIT